MMKCLLRQIRNHPIPWYVHPLLIALLIYPYNYYFSVIHMPVENALDALYLAVQQLLFFYPAIYFLPATLQGVKSRWGGALGVLLGLWLLAEAFIHVASVLHGQFEFRFSSLTNFVYDAENGEWMFPLTTATVGITLLYQTCVIMLNENREKDRFAGESSELNRRLNQVASEWYTSQLNPHLLNGLLAISRQLVYTKSPHAFDAYQEITRILQYYIALKPDTTLIPLSDELAQCKRLLFIHELAHGDQLMLRWDVQFPDDALVLVPPLLILMLLKNLLKFGDLANPELPALFRVRTGSQHLTFETRNPVRAVNHTDKSGAGTGLTQIERKLRERYGNDFTFTYSVIHGEFFVCLDIPVRVDFFH